MKRKTHGLSPDFAAAQSPSSPSPPRATAHVAKAPSFRGSDAAQRRTTVRPTRLTGVATRWAAWLAPVGTPSSARGSEGSDTPSSAQGSEGSDSSAGHGYARLEIGTYRLSNSYI